MLTDQISEVEVRPDHQEEQARVPTGAEQRAPSAQLFAASLCLYLFKSGGKECVRVFVCVCGGGVLAGVEQSCNEQILERE